jgi:hypothetical protein
MSESSSNLRSLIVAAAAIAAVGLTSNGCGSSSVSGAPRDGGADGPVVIHRGDGGVADSAAGGDTGTGTGTTDGTVGNACQSDADCQPAGGPGVNTCSISTFNDAIYPTPVCVSRGCDPGSDGFAHFCDGTSDDPSAPGFCLPIGQGQGVCLPRCLARNDGSAPVGCRGKDNCVVAAFATDLTTNQPVAIGYCFGGCTANSDCPAGNSCQTDIGICVRTVTAPTKQVGQACTSADNGSTTTPATCNCLVNPNTGNGYCTQFCAVNSTTATCPTGYICDSFEPKTLTDSTGVTVAGFTTQNSALAGSCVVACSLPDAGGDGGSSTCPAGSTCTTSETAGNDCLP